MSEAPQEAPMFSTARLVERIREEYVAMPGLKLTREQVCRLWGVRHDTCEAALDALLAEGFLHYTGTGKYVALPRPAGASVSMSGEAAGSAIRCPHCGKRNTVDPVQMSHGHTGELPMRCEGCHRIFSSTKRSA
jgi:hypothetical protein